LNNLLIRIDAQKVLIFALIYYGFSIYFDILFYDITSIHIFLNRAPDYYPSTLYFYSWIIPTIFSLVSIFILSAFEPKEIIIENSNLHNDVSIFIPIGYAIYFFILLIILPSADNRAAVFLSINEDFVLISWLLPIVIWTNCFSILVEKTKLRVFLAFFLILLVSLTLVDRSYLLMGVMALLFRVKRLNLFLLIFLTIIGFIVVTYWKVVLFWLVFGVDLEASLVNVQPGLARFEAITSQSIFVNCIEFGHCKAIDFGTFVESTLGRIAPSFIYQSDIPTTQIRYITEFFPQIANKGGGLGYSLVAEFALVMGNLAGPWMLSIYIVTLLIIIRLSKSPFISFIFAVYFLRFLRVDFGTGIKAIFVFGFLSLLLYYVMPYLVILLRSVLRTKSNA